MEKLTLRVTGMSCEGCEDRIKTALRRLNGVRFASADHERGQVRVAFDPAVISAHGLSDCIEQAGYTVAEIADTAS